MKQRAGPTPTKLAAADTEGDNRASSRLRDARRALMKVSRHWTPLRVATDGKAGGTRCRGAWAEPAKAYRVPYDAVSRSSTGGRVDGVMPIRTAPRRSGGRWRRGGGRATCCARGRVGHGRAADRGRGGGARAVLGRRRPAGWTARRRRRRRSQHRVCGRRRGRRARGGVFSEAAAPRAQAPEPVEEVQSEEEEEDESDDRADDDWAYGLLDGRAKRARSRPRRSPFMSWSRENEMEQRRAWLDEHHRGRGQGCQEGRRDGRGCARPTSLVQAVIVSDAAAPRLVRPLCGSRRRRRVPQRRGRSTTYSTWARERPNRART